MRFRELIRTEKFAALSVFIGSAALVTWLGGSIWKVLHGYPTHAIGYLIINAVHFPPLPILSVIGLWWGMRILRNKPCRRKRLLQALIPIILLSPILCYVGVILPYAPRLWISNTLLRDRTPIMSEISPDNKNIAYVEKYMTAGGWGERYFVKRSKDSEGQLVGRTGDYNRCNRIHWSPDNAIVVFEQHANLLAIRMQDMKKQYIDLAYTVDAQGHCHPHALQKIAFPKPDAFVIYYRDGTASRTVDLAFEISDTLR